VTVTRTATLRADVSQDREKPKAGLSVTRLMIASLSSLAAALIVSRLWGGGTLIGAAMTPVIVAHGGVIDEIIGDAIFVLFGAPFGRPDDAERAVRCAWAMQEALAAFNAANRSQALPELRHGIGVHTGTVVAGNIGSSERLSYALVGDPVNLASRIQGLTKELRTDVLVSGTTRARVGDDVPFHPLPAVKVKGRVAEVEVYALG